MWKKIQSDNKTPRSKAHGFLLRNKKKKRVKSAFLALGALILFLFIGQTIGFFSAIQKPLSLNSGIVKSSSWDGDSSLNFIVAFVKKEDASFSVLSFHPKEQNLVILNLSDQIYFNLPKEFGAWQLSSIYPLGQQENPPVGASLLQLSISKLLGLPIDGLIITDHKSYADNPEELVKRLKNNPILMGKLFTQIKTNLSLYQSAKLFWALSKVRSDKIVSLDLARSSITDSKLLPDSTRVLGVDNFRMDYFIRENMQDQVMVDESVAVAIFNATERAGLAQEVSRVITNMGGNVIMTGVTEEKLGQSKVVLKTENLKEISQTAKRLTQIYAPDCLTKPCVISDQKVTNSRAVINIIIGEDYFDLWYHR